MKIIIFLGVWITITVIAWCNYKANSNVKKMKVMNCRSVLRRYSKLDEMDKKSIL